MNPRLISPATAVVLTIALTIAVVLLLCVIRRSRRPTVRVSGAAAIVVLLVASPFLFDAAVMRLNPTSGMSYVSIDPGWIMKISPAVIAAIVAGAMISRKRRDELT